MPPKRKRQQQQPPASAGKKAGKGKGKSAGPPQKKTRAGGSSKGATKGLKKLGREIEQVIEAHGGTVNLAKFPKLYSSKFNKVNDLGGGVLEVEAVPNSSILPEAPAKNVPKRVPPVLQRLGSREDPPKTPALPAASSSPKAAPPAREDPRLPQLRFLQKREKAGTITVPQKEHLDKLRKELGGAVAAATAASASSAPTSTVRTKVSSTAAGGVTAGIKSTNRDSTAVGKHGAPDAARPSVLTRLGTRSTSELQSGSDGRLSFGYDRLRKATTPDEVFAELETAKRRDSADELTTHISALRRFAHFCVHPKATLDLAEQRRIIISDNRFHKLWVNLCSCLSKASPDDVSESLWALAILEYPPPRDSASHPLLAKLIGEMQQHAQKRAVKAHQVAKMVWALAKLRAEKFDRDLLSTMITTAPDMRNLEPALIGKMFWGVAAIAPTHKRVMATLLDVAPQAFASDDAPMSSFIDMLTGVALVHDSIDQHSFDRFFKCFVKRIPDANLSQLAQMLSKLATIPRRLLSKGCGEAFSAVARAIRHARVNTVQLCAMVSAGEDALRVDVEQGDNILEALSVAAEPVLFQLTSEELLHICSSYIVPAVNRQRKWAIRLLDAAALLGVDPRSPVIRDARTESLLRMAGAFANCTFKSQVAKSIVLMAEGVGTELQQRTSFQPSAKGRSEHERAQACSIAMIKSGWLPRSREPDKRDHLQGNAGTNESRMASRSRLQHGRVDDRNKRSRSADRLDADQRRVSTRLKSDDQRDFRMDSNRDSTHDFENASHRRKYDDSRRSDPWDKNHEGSSGRSDEAHQHRRDGQDRAGHSASWSDENRRSNQAHHDSSRDNPGNRREDGRHGGHRPDVRMTGQIHKLEEGYHRRQQMQDGMAEKRYDDRRSKTQTGVDRPESSRGRQSRSRSRSREDSRVMDRDRQRGFERVRSGGRRSRSRSRSREDSRVMDRDRQRDFERVRSGGRRSRSRSRSREDSRTMDRDRQRDRERTREHERDRERERHNRDREREREQVHDRNREREHGHRDHDRDHRDTSPDRRRENYRDRDRERYDERRERSNVDDHANNSHSRARDRNEPYGRTQHENSEDTFYNDRDRTSAADWICSTCNSMNFARRSECHSCLKVRDASDQPKPREGKNVLVVSELHELIDEAALYDALSIHGALKTVRLSKTKQGVSLKLATVEFHTERDTEAAYSKLPDGLYINGHHCLVMRGGDALSAGKRATRRTDDKQQIDARAPVQTDSGFVWDEKSGYWYHKESGYYYDSNTQRYYDSSTGQWYQVDASGNYIPIVDASAAAAASTTVHTVASPAAAPAATLSGEKEALAHGHQTAKDMAKWLKKTKKQQAAYEAEIIERDRVKAEEEKLKREEEKRALEEQAAATGDLSFLDIIG